MKSFSEIKCGISVKSIMKILEKHGIVKDGGPASVYPVLFTSVAVDIMGELNDSGPFMVSAFAEFIQDKQQVSFPSDERELEDMFYKWFKKKYK